MVRAGWSPRDIAFVLHRSVATVEKRRRELKLDQAEAMPPSMLFWWRFKTYLSWRTKNTADENGNQNLERSKREDA